MRDDPWRWLAVGKMWEMMKASHCRPALAAAAVFSSLLTPVEADATKFRVVSGIIGATDEKSKELSALPPDAANRVARRDLVSVFQPAGTFTLTNGIVEGKTLVTWPYPTRYRFACREDRVTLQYRFGAHFDAAGKFVDDELQPVGVDAQPQFHIEQLPVPGFIPGSSYAATICDARHPDAKANWFAAPNATDAVRAANMFRMAEDEVKAGRLKPGPCDRPNADACRKWIASLDDMSKIESVETCNPPASDDACYVVSFDNYDLTIVATMSAGDPERITPSTIVSVHGDDVVTVFE